ncbi:uncharacterized protein LY89DRAFT_718576 [Mollisia scopiformis]|uniref:Uncharacterized protein n=1 Tax=Mollisia scopiformis TaxID=149040 RepID=A0A194X9I7_MOLSC|nr:uncharacterized protein LY89DRAFT_718576 [Mollisia scopiformis]KUJ16833.1 hypothetical protein LY89DRAFT_718576 [Mollisia scopiformis]
MAGSDDSTLNNSPHAAQLDAHHILQYGPSEAQRNPSTSSASSSQAAMRKKRESATRPQAYSSSSRNTQTSSSTKAENKAAQRDVRTLPPWIDSYEEGDEILTAKPTDRLLTAPSQAHSAQHHYDPKAPERRRSRDGYIDPYEEIPKKPAETGFFGGHKEPVKGRKWDHARDGDPVIMQSGVLPNSSSWRTYIKSSMYGPRLDEDGERVDEEFLQQQTPGYQKPWRGDIDGGDDPEKLLPGLIHSKKQRRTFVKRLQHNLLMHPLVPLVFRVTVLTTSAIALGIAGSVHHLSDRYTYSQNASTTMAIVVDVVAIPYILYVTWDEYTGKPLGLRSPKAKIRLVLLDLFFIIFESANLALAFGALTDANGSCRSTVSSPFNALICDRVKALCGILMVALIAWSLTFSVSIFRLVERVGGREESD